MPIGERAAPLSGLFEWEIDKERYNIKEHGISFGEAKEAFHDPGYLILPDLKHSEQEERFFCIGRVGERVMTVRFTKRGETIRIFGVGYWRKGRKIYEGYYAE